MWVRFRFRVNPNPNPNLTLTLTHFDYRKLEVESLRSTGHL